MGKDNKKAPMTTWQKISLNIKIVLMIIVLILLAFFLAYVFKTSLDDVLTNENTTKDGSSVVVTTVYELGGDESSDISENGDS